MEGYCGFCYKLNFKIRPRTARLYNDDLKNFSNPWSVMKTVAKSRNKKIRKSCSASCYIPLILMQVSFASVLFNVCICWLCAYFVLMKNMW